MLPLSAPRGAGAIWGKSRLIGGPIHIKRPRRRKAKIKPVNVGVFTVLGVILAAAGILTPILWDRYKTTLALELHHVANIKLVESADLPEKLQLTYDGHIIPTLSRHTFSLINTGRTPILKDALIVPLTITFQGNVELLEVTEDARSPQDLDVRYAIQANENSVVVSFSLMNPGDQVQFGVLLAGSTSDYTAKARIVGIRELKVIERVVEFLEVKETIPLTVYFVGGVSVILALIMFFGAIPELLEDSKIRDAIASDAFHLPNGKSKEDYLNFLRATFTYKTKKELEPLTSFIEGLPSDVPLGKEYHDQIRNLVIKYVKEKHAIVPVIIILGFLSGFGFLYVLSRIL